MTYHEPIFIKSQNEDGQPTIATQNERIIAAFDSVDRFDDACLETCLKALNDAPPPIDVQDEQSDEEHAEHKLINDYLKDRSKCPLCKSSDVQDGDTEFKADIFILKVACNSCEAEWSDKYQLNNIEITKRGTHHPK